MARAVFEFPNEAARDSFLAWFSDGGGEYNYLVGEEDAAFDDERKPIVGFDYTKAFGEVVGDPIVVAREGS
jgi:hypothetical protein